MGDSYVEAVQTTPAQVDAGAGGPIFVDESELDDYLDNQ